MKAKKVITGTALIIIILVAITSIAQPPGRSGERRENIEAQKIAFITGKLDLSPEEAQQFWPVYNQCQKRQKAMREKNKPTSADGKRPDIDEMSDKEVEELINRQLAVRQQDLDIQRDCLEQYKKVLPIKKVAKLFQVEKQFKRELLKQIKGRNASHNKEIQKHKEIQKRRSNGY